MIVDTAANDSARASRNLEFLHCTSTTPVQLRRRGSVAGSAEAAGGHVTGPAVSVTVTAAAAALCARSRNRHHQVPGPAGAAGTVTGDARTPFKFPFASHEERRLGAAEKEEKQRLPTKSFVSLSPPQPQALQSS
eukprot:2254288-Rhodomonas_salina.3